MLLRGSKESWEGRLPRKDDSYQAAHTPGKMSAPMDQGGQQQRTRVCTISPASHPKGLTARHGGPRGAGGTGTPGEGAPQASPELTEAGLRLLSLAGNPSQLILSTSRGDLDRDLGGDRGLPLPSSPYPSPPKLEPGRAQVARATEPTSRDGTSSPRPRQALRPCC